jgi:glycosyltransferase involved in cell wall biosynthesis
MRVVYSIGRYQAQSRRICDAVLAELARRGWLRQRRFHDEADEAIPDCDLFHGHSVLSLGTLRHLRRHRPGVRVVLQRDSAHIACPAYTDEIALRRGGPWDSLCTQSPNTLPERIPEQTEEYALADRVLLPSTYAAETFTAAGYPRERLRIVPLAAGDELRPAAELGLPEPPFRVVLGGGAILTKGYPYAVAACDLLGEPLDVLAGLPFAAMPAELARRSVCLAPSITDGMNHQVLAAMACGLVPIVSTATGARDLITPGVDGFVVDLAAGDPVAEIAGHLRFLRDHPEERRRMGERARAAVAGRSWEDYGREVCDLYAEVMAAAPVAASTSAGAL